MFGTVLISVCSLLHVYVFWRITSIPLIKKVAPPGVVAAIALVLWALFFTARYFGRGREGWAWTVLKFAGMNWMGTLFLIFAALILIDLATGFGFLFSRRAPALRAWALAIGVLLSIIAHVQGLRPPVINQYDVPINGLAGGLNGVAIAAVADTHLGWLIDESWLGARVDQILALKPDLVVLLGDIVEGRSRSLNRFLPQLSRIRAPLGVYAVPGNHEFHGGSDAALKLFRSAGFAVLRDKWIPVLEGLTIAGLDDFRRHRRPRSRDDAVSQALEGHPPGTVILLSHRPPNDDRSMKAAAASGAHLMLCGHTHGGQIWPFSYIVSRFYPLLAGQYNVDGLPIIVTRGAGTWGPRMRLWPPGEILLLTLRSK